MRLPNAYQSCLSIEEQRVVLVPSEEAIDIRAIKRGILFILARWSGASQLAFRTLNKALSSLPKLDDLSLYIMDTDSDYTQELLFKLGDVPAGAGETYWLVEGQIQHKLSGYKEEAFSVLRDYTQHILPPNNQLSQQDAPRYP
jgi:hypothetical protein